jgi:hypothetical protein
MPAAASGSTGTMTSGNPNACSPQRRHIGSIAVGPLAVGLFTAVALVAAPFVPSRMNVLTGVVLLGFAFWVGLAGGAVRAVQRSAAALGGYAGRVPGSRRSDLPPAARLGCAGGVRLGQAAAAARACCLGDSSGAPAAAQPNRAVAGVSAAGGAGPVLDGRRLRDRTRVDRRDRIPPPGRLIDVGGHRLHLNCIGTGSPTVVHEPGLGEVSCCWTPPRPNRGAAPPTKAGSYDLIGRISTLLPAIAHLGTAHLDPRLLRQPARTIS